MQRDYAARLCSETMQQDYAETMQRDDTETMQRDYAEIMQRDYAAGLCSETMQRDYAARLCSETMLRVEYLICNGTPPTSPPPHSKYIQIIMKSYHFTFFSFFSL